jgi:hypothetical protein
LRPFVQFSESKYSSFIRVESLTGTDPTTSFPFESFSAKYTYVQVIILICLLLNKFPSDLRMAGMTGTFNATVQAEINGQSTAPIGGPTASSAGGPASTGATSKPAATHSGSASASAAKSTSSNGANSRYAVSGFGALVGVAAVFGIAL